MGRGKEPQKMEIDLSLNIDVDNENEGEATAAAKVDDRVKEDEKEEIAQTQDKEEVPEATAGEIEDDASVVEISLQDNTKAREVIFD